MKHPINRLSFAAMLLSLFTVVSAHADREVGSTIIDMPPGTLDAFTNTSPDNPTMATIGGATATVTAIFPFGYYDNRPALAPADWTDDKGMTHARGWTHNSAWLVFDGKKGQTVQVEIQAKSNGAPTGAYHPGFALWYAPKYPNQVGGDCKQANTVPCVPAHLYPQLANWGWSDGAGAKYYMPFVNAAFDADTNGGDIVVDAVLAKEIGNRDGKAGHLLTRKFELPATGKYMMVTSNALEGDPTLLPTGQSFDVTLRNCSHFGLNKSGCK